MNRKYSIVAIMLLISITMLAGCGTPQRTAVSPQETVPAVQAAVDRYILTHHTPPVKPRSGESGWYERYPIDFRLLMQTLQLSEVPSNAYENGGPYYYVLLQSGQAWEVKVIDMPLWQTVTDIQTKADAYAQQTGRIPAGAMQSAGLYALDAKALGLDSQQVRSVYSPQLLPLLITEEGTVVIDYAFEIMKTVQSLSDQFQPTDDVREVLTDNSFMAPVHSLPYKWIDGEPVIQAPS